MKKLPFLLIILFFLFSLPDCLFAKYVPTKGTVIKKVNLRRKPKKKSKVIYVFKKNTELKIKKVSKRKKWYKVSNGKKVGWVTSKKIQVTEGYDDSRPTKEQVTELDRDLDKSLGLLMTAFSANRNLINPADKSIFMDESNFSSVESSPDDFEPVDVTEGFDLLSMPLATDDDDEYENPGVNEDDSTTNPDETTDPDDTNDQDDTTDPEDPETTDPD